jgi:hypothetical protein
MLVKSTVFVRQAFAQGIREIEIFESVNTRGVGRPVFEA